MDMSVDEKGTSNDRPASPSERGDALSTIKKFAYLGYREVIAGTDEEFEELWRTAFNVAPNPTGHE
jgi:hypothetical protein